MRSANNRPIIDPDDYPTTVEAALDWTRRQTLDGGHDEHSSWLEKKQLEEARDAVRDGFATMGNGEMLRPNGSATLMLSFGGLENAIRTYRSGLVLDKEPDSEELARIEELLARIEQNKPPQ